MGGVAKPLLELGASTLLGRTIAALYGCAPLTVAADELVPGLPDVDWVREEPPFSGPAAAVVAVLAAWETRGLTPEWCFLLAGDLAHPDAVVETLRAAAPAPTPAPTPGPAAEADGLCLVDAAGQRQWLAGLYRTAALQHAARELPDAGRDAPIRRLLGGLTLREVPAPDAATADVDTWEDLERARESVAREELP